MSEEAEILKLSNEDVKEYIELLGKVTREFIASKMEEDEFKWTDKLVKEYLRLVTAVEGDDYWQSEINKFKQAKQNSFTIKADKDSSGVSEEFKNDLSNAIKERFDSAEAGVNAIFGGKDWEILESDGGMCITTYPPKYIDPIIKKVKRLTDGEVFSVGDDTNDGKLLGFKLNDYYGILAHLEKGNCYYPLSYVRKAKQRLFKTEDGRDVFEGGIFYWINTSYESYWTIFEKIAGVKDGYDVSSCKYFSTEEAAKEYVLWNKPELSLNDILDAAMNPDSADVIAYINPNKLKELVQQKINGAQFNND